MKSSFTGNLFLIIFGIVILTGIAIGLTVYSVNPLHHVPLSTSITGILLLVLFIVWLIVIVLGRRLVEITLFDDHLEVKKFIGLAKPHSYLFSALDGFKTDAFSYRQNHYERVCVLKNGKVLFEISSYFHKDYFGLKEALTFTLKELS